MEEDGSVKAVFHWFNLINMEEVNRIRVIIADDHMILRQGLRILLEHEDDIEVVGEASNGQEVLSMLENMPTDLVLMDINMPVMDGYMTTEELRRAYPKVKVIALSMHNNLPFVHKMIECGASGYVLKSTNKEELVAAIKIVANGGQYISGDLSLKLLEQTKRADSYDRNVPGEEKGLSKREIEVLTLIAEGYTNAEIADKLFTSKRTIETHRQNILEKTQAKNTANLIKYAIEHNIISIRSQT